ncbi:MAG: class I tRNA ligase family protein [Parcubacteria group bacterium]|nr:class I tRNA ligase family protein [Parcubacteria group bacterium]MCR4342474.1 class I tRNA ligase family protein [Patescibacteria group bacterium]
MEDDLKSKSPAEAEKDILKFWQDNKIFEKTLEKDAPSGDFIFYDGPPFANGLPHYGHILASVIKDAIPRYKTMRGYRVPRRWGWDCHGLPVENVVEKELGLKAKKDIEDLGLEKFNKAARNVVVRDTSEWKKIIPKIGRFVDMEADYKTMDPSYMESVWWVFKTLYDKGLVYEGYKPMHLCPRCETTLANFEVSQGYKDITDISVTAKFELDDEPGTFVLAWTTTPWTLPGNVALAVNPDILYAKIEKDGERFILAKDRLDTIEGEYKIIETFKGFALAGKSYKPLFDYYSEKKDLENRENGWKIYSADFVTTEEGTGVVHIAPAFGEDDMNVSLEYALPFVQHVSADGRFKSEVKDFAGRFVKPKENHQETDIEIIKHLAHAGKLFAKKKIVHSYPHCWRCDTPLLNYATSSWFVKVTAIKDNLLKNNGEINWVPAHIKDGRFGKWLEGARDWAISRSRFWGAPLPVWKCDKCDKLEIAGSIDDIRNKVKKSGNKYFVMRHGESEHNKKNIVSSNVLNPHHITEKGKTDIKEIAQKVKKENIDIIFSSDFVRTKETAELLASEIGCDKRKIIYDKRIRELNTGTFDGKRPRDYHDYFSTLEEKFTKTPPEGENLVELKNRVSQFLYDIEEKYQDKNILIISHEYPIWLLSAGAVGADIKKSVKMKEEKRDDYIETGELMELDFVPLPHNENYEIDLHRPYIDKVEFACSCGGKMKRIIHVFDCWFESGSMPYASAHYPFACAQNQKSKIKNQKCLALPAEFIAEGLDQTRGWFYTLLVLSTALFEKPAYKNVIVNGIILAEDGQKISKRLKNYPDPMDVVHKYGADALRLYLLSSPVVRAEDLNFSEHGVDEVYKKVILRLWNVYSFYDMYALGGSTAKLNLAVEPPNGDKNVLDKWIIARLLELEEEITLNLEKYELDKATRPIFDFVDDLSTWYIRRSRDRFKNEGEDKGSAILTTRFVLVEFSKVIAPFIPFISERLYQLISREDEAKSNSQNLIARSAKGGFRESIHLDEWPYKKSLADNVLGMFGVDKSTKNLDILYDMKEIRKIVSLGLEARAEAGFKVRQPLQKLIIKNEKLKGKDDLLELVKDEVNVKEVAFDAGISNEVKLDLELTPELIAEGQFRDMVRFVQGLRKKASLTPDDEISVSVKTSSSGQELLKKFENEFKEIVNARTVEFKDIEDGELLKLDDLEIHIKITK